MFPHKGINVTPCTEMKIQVKEGFRSDIIWDNYRKDARLPEQLQRAMAAEAEASREARAKVIAADGEMRASKALREASCVIEQSPAAMQLRYLQTLNSISSEKNSTILFPVPLEMVAIFMGAKEHEA